MTLPETPREEWVEAMLIAYEAAWDRAHAQHMHYAPLSTHGVAMRDAYQALREAMEKNP